MKSDEIEDPQGERQGYILSPLLFNVYNEETLEERTELLLLENIT